MCPVGEVQMMVPSGNWRSRQPARAVPERFQQMVLAAQAFEIPRDRQAAVARVGMVERDGVVNVAHHARRSQPGKRHVMSRIRTQRSTAALGW